MSCSDETRRRTAKPSGVGSFLRRFSAAADLSGDAEGRLRFACFGTSGRAVRFFGVATGLTSTFRFFSAAGAAFLDGGGDVLDVGADAEVEEEADEATFEETRADRGLFREFEGGVTGCVSGKVDEPLADAVEGVVDDVDAGEALVEGIWRPRARFCEREAAATDSGLFELDDAPPDDVDVIVEEVEVVICCRASEADADAPDE